MKFSGICFGFSFLRWFTLSNRNPCNTRIRTIFFFLAAYLLVLDAICIELVCVFVGFNNSINFSIGWRSCGMCYRIAGSGRQSKCTSNCKIFNYFRFLCGFFDSSNSKTFWFFWFNFWYVSLFRREQQLYSSLHKPVTLMWPKFSFDTAPTSMRHLS